MQLFGNKGGGKHTGSSKKTRTDYEYTEPEYNTSSRRADRAADMRAEEAVSSGKKKKKTKKTWKIVLIVLLALIVLAGAAYYVVFYVLPKAPEADGGGMVNGNTETPEGRKEGVYTFLVAGLDQVSNNTDTIMVGSFDTVNNKLNIVSIPRDTLINLSHEVKKANSAYHYAAYYTNVPNTSYYGCDPVESMRSELIENMLGFNVDNYVIVNLDAAKEVVDTIGGVEFDLPIDMHYDAEEQNLHINLNKGLQTLSGEQFVQVMRFRSSYAGGDIDRIEMQHKLLMSLANQMLTLKNVPNASKVAEIIADNMDTNLSTENILFYLKEFLELDTADINFYTMPGNTNGNIFGESYVFVDIDGWLKMVNDYLNPYTTDVTVDNVNIVTYADGYFYYTNDEDKLKGGVSSFNVYVSNPTMANAGLKKYTPQT